VTETEGRVRRALDGDGDGLRSRVLPLDDIEILSRAKGGDGRTVVAYAATFGHRAEIHDQDGHYTEENHPQAFHKTVADRGVRFGAFYHHGRTLHGTPSEEGSVPIGRPVLVKPDSRGLLTHTAYNRTPLADRVLESIRNGDPMGMSYTGAYLQSDPPQAPYRSRSDGSLQHVVRKEIALIEYGPTPMPAYSDAAILGVRAAQAREAARAAGDDAGAERPDGPEPYRQRPGENVQCPGCGAYNEADANYCDQCDIQLPDSAFPDGRQAYQRTAPETVQCPACSRFNEPDAVYCDQCGAILPVSAYEGVPAMPGGTDAMAASGDAGTAAGGRAASTARHEPVTGTHSHAHPAYGSQGGDAMHSHEHSHDGDAAHSHSHAPSQDSGDAPAGRAQDAADGRERAAVAVHRTDVTDGTWDAGENISRLPPITGPAEAAQYKRVYAWYDSSGPDPDGDGLPDRKQDWKLPHHEVSADGTPGAASIDGVRAALSRLGQENTGIPDAQKSAVQAHLQAHMDDWHKQQGGSSGDSAASPASSTNDTGTSGRTETTPAAATGTGAGERTAPPETAAEPRQHSADAPASTERGNTVEPTIEERMARRTEIETRLTAIGAEYGERALTPELQAEWDTLSAEADTHAAAISGHERVLTARRERLAAIAARQTGERVNGTEAGFTVPDGTAARNAPAFVPSRDDIYDVRAVRSRGLSPDDAALAYRDHAMRAVERAAFPGSESRERAQATVERLLHAVDDEDGTLAKRIMITGNPVYMRAWAKTMARVSSMGLTPEELAALERGRALAVGTGSAGGFAVPFELDPTVILTSNGAINPLRQISRIATITGKEYDLVTSAGVTVSRSAEGTAMSDNTPTLAQPTVKANRVTGFIPFSMEIEQDWHALQSEMMMLLADAKDVEEANSFTLGDGTGTNAGGIITTLSTASAISGGTTATLAASDLYALENAMAPRFRSRASWMASKTTYNAYRQTFTAVASSAGDPWVRPSQGTPAELLGYPAYEASDMVTTHASNDKVIILGDFGRGFLIVDRVGMSTEIAPVLFDQSTGRPSGQRGLIAFWRNNSRILVDNAFRVLKVL
jgi:HK97 family phage major capsid protein/HK97 family phage prohead protease